MITLLLLAMLGILAFVWVGFAVRGWTRQVAAILSGHRSAIRELQGTTDALERAIADGHTALMYLNWRLVENGVMADDDALADDVEVIN